MKKKKLNQTQALAMWMKSGKWIDLNIARKELGITRLPEIIRRVKEEFVWGWFIEEETVNVDSRYGKTRIKRWRANKDYLSSFKMTVNWFCK